MLDSHRRSLQNRILGEFSLALAPSSLITPPISRGRAQHVLVPYRSVLPFRESSRWKATTLLKERLEPSLGKESRNARQSFPVLSRSPAIPSSPMHSWFPQGCSRSSCSCGEQTSARNAARAGEYLLCDTARMALGYEKHADGSTGHCG